MKEAKIVRVELEGHGLKLEGERLENKYGEISIDLKGHKAINSS